MRRPVRWCLVSAAIAVCASVCCQGGAANALAVSPHARGSTEVRPGVYVPPSQDLSLGDQGPAVLSVQQRLAQLGYYPGPTDGVYGPDLEEAVWAFKEVQGLPLLNGSSYIGPDFLAALAYPVQPQALVPGGGANRIEINQTIQVLVLYQDNQPALILHVSTGGRYYFCNKGSCGYAVTPDGDFTALSYLAGDIQVPLGFMENPVFFIGRAYAIHGGDPVPWYPASHGCVRIYADAVDWFHNDVQIGATPIYIRGTAP